MSDEQKDIWDKFEVIGKVAGAILVPIAVASSVFIWNAQRTKQETTATMTQIAISILREEPAEDGASADPIRLWAIDVLKNPSSPPPLSPRAEIALQEGRLPSAWGDLPPYPEDCRLTSTAGVEEGERLDVAVLKYDNALSRQNARTAYCAEWYDGIAGRTIDFENAGYRD